MSVIIRYYIGVKNSKKKGYPHPIPIFPSCFPAQPLIKRLSGGGQALLIHHLVSPAELSKLSSHSDEGLFIILPSKII